MLAHACASRQAYASSEWQIDQIAGIIYAYLSLEYFAPDSGNAKKNPAREGSFARWKGHRGTLLALCTAVCKQTFDIGRWGKVGRLGPEVVVGQNWINRLTRETIKLSAYFQLPNRYH